MKPIYVIFMALIAMQSCKLNEEKEWDVDLLSPVANASLSIADLIKDNTLQQNSNGTITIVQSAPLASINVGDIIKVRDTTYPKNVTLKKLALGRRELQRNVSLGEIAGNAGLAGQVIIINHGKKMVIPSLNGLSSGAMEVDAENFFETATFIDGTIEIEMYNGFPVEITDVNFELRNKTDNALIVSDVIASLQPGARFNKKYPLANKTVEGKLVAEIKNMNSPGSNGQQVLIDTSDALEVKIAAYNMQLLSAKAIFPAQNVVEDSVDIVYKLGDAAIKFIRVKSGNIHITAKHTIQENLNLRYLVPGAMKNGQPLDILRVVKAALPGEESKLSELVPIDGYEIDLTGRNNDTFNTFFNILNARIDSSGKLQTLSLLDEISLEYGLKDVVTSYARGYLGKETYTIGPETVGTETFNKIISGSISLDNLMINLELENGVGAPGIVTIKTIKATNSKTKASKNLTDPEIIGKAIKIPPATDNPFQPSITTIAISGKEAKEMLEILPDKFEYELQVVLNADGNKSNYNDFVYSNSKISANLNLEIPAEIGINGITLQDTFPITETENESSTVEAVKNALLHINMENGFPADADFQLYVLNENNAVTDSLFTTPIRMQAGKINAVTQKVDVPVTSKYLVEISEERWKHLQESGNKLMILSKISTSPPGTPMKIYSSYQLKIQIAAEIRYRSSI